MGDTLISMFRSLCGIIDSVIYILISKLYELLIETSNMILYSQNAMDAIGKRIGLILGIVMLFRLAISLISYIISPDKLSDSAKGGGKLIKNTIFALILLITINIIFSQAYKLQIKVVESKFIEKIFFGTQAELPNVDLAYSLYSSFLTPSIEACEDMFDPNVGITSDCETEISALKNNVTISALQYVMDNHELNYILINYSALNTKVNGDYLFNYFMIVSTVAGGIVALLLITFTMDLAVRAVKLLFLQIIAPFPIIASIDPGKGSDVFKKWSKECINTYISLFIRLIAINFAVFMMTLIRTEFHDVFALKGPLMTVLIIVGCLMFAKQAPKLIEDMTGLKTDGFALNPIKKFQEQALFGKNITGMGAAIGAGTATFAANTFAKKGNILSGLAGAGSAFARGTAGAIKGEKFGQIYKEAYNGAIQARNNRDARNKLEISAPDIWWNSFQRKIGVDTTSEKQDANVKMYDEFFNSGDALVSISESEVQKHADKINIGHFSAVPVSATNLRGGTDTFTTLAQLREAISDTTSYDAATRATLHTQYEKIKGDAETKYREYAAINGSNSLNASTEFRFIAHDDINGAKAKTHADNLNDILKHNEKELYDNGVATYNARTRKYELGDLKKATKRANYISTNIKNSGEYRRAHKIQEQTNREKK